MNFSTNQVNQFYVYDAAKHDMKAVLSEDHKSFYFTYKDGDNVALRTDIIPIDKVIRQRAIAAAKQQIPMEKHVITIHADTLTEQGNPRVGQEYCLSVRIAPYQGFGDEDYTVITASAVAHEKSTPTTLLKALGDDLNKSLNEFQKELIEVKPSGATLEIKTLPQTAQWVRGISPVEIVKISISAAPIEISDVEMNWLVDTVSPDAKVLKNGYAIADMEYFFHGERGDQYREAGYPNVIRYNYLVNPTDDTEYDVLDIHFYSDDSKEGVQKSEKDLTIVAKAGTLDTLIEAANLVLAPSEFVLDTVA